jgi:ferredoxin
MKLVVRAERCSGHGRCYTLAPELLSCDDEGFVTIRGAELLLTQEQLDDARRAARGCPEDAISLIETE